MERGENAIRNIIWGMVYTVIHFILPLLSRMLILQVMGKLYLGVGSLFSSILGMLSLAELGFSAAITYSMYRPVAEGDTEKVCALLNFYRKCYRVIGCVILIAGLAIMPFIKYLINGEYPTDINLYLVYFLYLINTVASYLLFAYRRPLLQANQRNDVESKVATVTMFLQNIGQIAVLVVFRNYYLFVFVMVVTTLSSNLMIGWQTTRMYPMYVCQGSIDGTDYIGLKKQVGGLFLRRLGDVVLGSVDNIVISAFLGLGMVAMYGNYYCITMALFTVNGVVSTALIGAFGNIVAKESQEFQYKEFRVMNLLYVMLIAFLALCYLCLVQPFMKLWVGADMVFDQYTTILFVAYFFFYKWCDMPWILQEASGIWWETRFVPLIAAIVNVTLNLILVQFIGIQGILLSTIISIIFVYNVGYIGIVFRICFGKVASCVEYVFRQICYLLVAVIDMSVCMWLCRFGPQEGIKCLVYRGGICLIIGIPGLLLGASRFSEFDEAVSYAKRLLRQCVKKYQK